MKFAVVGGDERLVRLCPMLRRDGHKVLSFAMEKAELPKDIPKAGCLQGCVYGADCVILPVPSEKAGLLNAPYTEEKIRMETLMAALWPGQILIGGKLSEGSCIAALHAGLTAEDIMNRRGYTVGNAAITAEGAIERMMAGHRRTIWKSRVLICGWGRIAKILALRLKALGAAVTVAARREGDRAMADALGMESAEFTGLENCLGGFDFIVNTVPARIFTDSMLCCIREDVLLLELASPPGGFDMKLAENIGLNAVSAPGLPGLYAPETAAELMKNAIYDIIGETGE